MNTSYFEYKAYNQSLIKKILIHPKVFQYYLKEREEIFDSELPKECLIIGNAVDYKLTENKELQEQFIIRDITPPTGQYKTFIDNLVKTKHKLTSKEEALTEHEWMYQAFLEVGSKVLDFEKVCKKLFEDKEHYDYYEYLVESLEKFVITSDQMEKINAIEQSFLTSPFTSEYFKKCSSCLILKQLEIYWTHMNLEIKSKLDLIYIDFENKTIQPIDIKVTENNRKFKTVMELFRYDIQAASYMKALESWIKEEENFSKFKDFKILPFRFLVESIKYPGNPLVYEFSEETMQKGLNDFEDAISRIYYHFNNDVWDYPREIYESNGVVVI